jgi:hypothetical protein|nr:MAG TPA: Neurensin [Caudoviricetes sp.]DAS64139.1 MAG TPA: Neurensin [Caudoviricetes sp.]DAX54336.1 MAG TPA: Neurensin [Caudoviricetes sp.]
MNFLDLNADGKTDSKDLQIWSALLLMVGGVVLLFLGFFSTPKGEIHGSVITTAAELFTFSGVLLGIDYHYSHLLHKTIADMQKKEEEEQTT